MGRSFSPGDSQLTIDTNSASNASAAGTPVDIGPFSSVFISIAWHDHDAVDATATIEISRHGLPAGVWETYPGSTYTLAAAAGEHSWILAFAGAIPYFRINYVNGTVAAAAAKHTTYARVEVPTSKG